MLGRNTGGGSGTTLQKALLLILLAQQDWRGFYAWPKDAQEAASLFYSHEKSGSSYEGWMGKWDTWQQGTRGEAVE